MSWWHFDAIAILVLVFTGIACGRVGVILHAQRQLMLGDGLAHALLPALVVAFVVLGSTGLGAAFVAAWLTVMLCQWATSCLRRALPGYGGDALGLVFSGLFALGIVLVSVLELDNVHLEPEHILFGQLENLIWLVPSQASDLLHIGIWGSAPVELFAALGACVVVELGLRWHSPHLVARLFDPAWATPTLGAPARAGLALMVSAAVLLAFLVAGALLAVAMLSSGAVIARVFARSWPQWLHGASTVSVLIGVGGYVLATRLPEWLALPVGLNAAATIALLGAVLAACASALKR